jgi:uncharacterized protein (DUF1330 family)
MAVYWLARAKITDRAQYTNYLSTAPDVIARYGGRVKARGGKFKILEGSGARAFDRFIVTEFDSFEQAEACFNSPEYQAAAAHRRGGGGNVEIVLLEATVE